MKQLLAAMLIVTLYVPAAAGQSAPRPRRGPVAVPSPPLIVQHPDLTPLDNLADEPFRPSWAPFPILWGGTAAVPTLLEQLSSPQPIQRMRAAFLLGQIAWPRSASRLAKALTDPSRGVRIHAGIALACLGDRRGLPAAVAALVGQPDWVKVYAVLGLWRLDDPAARAALADYAGGQSGFIRNLIAGALSSPPMMPPPGEPPAAGAERPSMAEIIDAAINAYMLETDWWWHNGGVYDQCIRCMQTALFLDPHMVHVYGDAAWLAWSMGKNNQALGILHRGVAANPHSIPAWFNLGQQYFLLKRFAAAAPYLRKAAELGEDRLSQGVYAHCLTKLGRLEESLAVWEHILEENPTDGAAIYNRDKVKRMLAQQRKQHR